MLFLNYMQFDTSIIIIVSKYQEKKMTAVVFITVFVRKYTLICAYMCLYVPICAYMEYDNGIIVDTCDDDSY